MPLIARTPHMLESILLRKSVGALYSSRHRCAHCRRTPLVGERVYLYAAVAASERLVCELCRPLRAEPPVRSEVVHSPEHDRCVRLRARRAA